MKPLVRILAFTAFVAASGTALHAQSTAQSTVAPTTTTANAKRRAHRPMPDSAQRAAVAAHQQAAVTQRKSLNAQVKTGALTKAQAREQMLAWQKANKVPGMRKQKRP